MSNCDMEGIPSKSETRVLTIGCLVVMITLVVGVWWFGNAFFPRKVPLEGTAGREAMEAHHVAPQYDRLVVMVVDAMRADFLYDVVLGRAEEDLRDRTAATERGERSGAEMEWVREKLIAEGQAVPLIGRAQAPTVTLPRVKALVSGSIPSFLDFVANFDSPSLQEDSIVRQLRAAGKRLHFYGDDTWLKLFPPEENIFSRHEGTTSFFVSDYTEVDQNVTRCLAEELSAPWKRDVGGSAAGEWDVLVLHYLGLDHIGHYQGPRSPLMPGKLREMDEVVQILWEDVLAKDVGRCSPDDAQCGTLLVLLGDHGMNEVGNHGGSSELETSTVLLFASSKLYGQAGEVATVDQVDLVPTLAIVLGVPIPLNSLGTVIPQLLQGDVGDPQRLAAYRRNAEQLMQVLQSYPVFWDDSTGRATCEDASLLHDMYVSVLSTHDELSETARDALLEEQFADLLQGFKALFINLLTAADTNGMVAGEFMVLFSAVLATALAVYCLAPAGLSPARFRLSLWILLRGWHKWLEVAAFGIVFVLYLVSMLTSSFVEEEHRVWYFLLPTLLVAIAATPSSCGVFWSRSAVTWAAVCLIIHRLAIPWNQTGDKWAHLQDIGDWLEEECKPEELSIASVSPGYILLLIFFCTPVLVVLALELRFVYRRWSGHEGVRLLFSGCGLVAGGLVAVYKVGQLHGLTTSCTSALWFQDWHLLCARSIYGLLGIQVAALAVTQVKESRTVALPWRLSSLVVCMLLMLLHRPRNQAPLLILLVQFKALGHLLKGLPGGPLGSRWKAMRATLLFQWFGRAGHFILGGSNGFATIDISGAYTGLSGYSPAVVGAFSGLILFSGPLLSFLLLLDFLRDGNISKTGHSIVAMVSIALLRSISVFVCSGIMIVLRTHLFIWTVFSPRFMFEILELVADGLKLFILLVSCFSN